MEASKPGPVAERRRRSYLQAGARYSALVGWGARRAVPTRLRSFAYRAFARAVGANLDEVELPLAGYESFGDFFARRLRDGARVIERASDAVIMPCDGVIAARGTAVDHAMVQAKGKQYRLDELLGDDAYAARLVGGAYATIYLSPRDYHRVHTPIDARVIGYDYLPGTLWPVNPRVAARRDGLLARNERVVIRLHSEAVGDVAVVMIAAAGVGNMRLVPGRGAPIDKPAERRARSSAEGDAQVIDTASFRAAHERRRIELSGVTVSRGDELGAFRLGSTVVLVFPAGAAQLVGEVGQAVRFGERLGSLQKGRAA